MADKNDDRQVFVELEYMLRKHFDEHCAAMVSSEVRTVREKSAEEYRRTLDAHPVAPGQSGMMNAFMAAQETNRTGEWSRKTADDLISGVLDRIKGDRSLAADLDLLARNFKSAAIRRIGKEEYDRLSKGFPHGDMATAYVISRYRRMVEEQLARSKVPRSSLQYITEKGFGNSLVGTLASMMSGVSTSDADERIERMAESMYGASAMERAASTAVTIGIDMATTGGGPASLAGKEGGALLTAKAMNCGKGLLMAYDVVNGMKSPSLDPDEVDASVSQAVLGSSSALGGCRARAKDVMPSRSRFLHALNGQLNGKVRLPEYRIPYSPHMQGVVKGRLSAAHGGDAAVCLSNVTALFAENGIRVSDRRDVPSWMLSKSPDELLRMSDYYVSTAWEMRRCGRKDIEIGRKRLSFDEVAQQGYDYARAADILRRQALTREESRAHAAAARDSAARVEDSPQDEEEGNVRKEQMRSSQGQWGGLMDMLGLKGAGDLSHNLGYTLAMLPDMLFGMLTGRSSSLKLEDNLLPLMAIFGGMFMKNPILKWTLIALGGVNLLNKGFGELSGRDARQEQGRSYKRYPDEPVSPRIRLHGIRDGVLIADIDGRACTVRVSDDAMAAYRDGSLSEGALCNAILRDYDVFDKESRRQYEEQARQQQDQQVVRMGVG